MIVCIFKLSCIWSLILARHGTTRLGNTCTPNYTTVCNTYVALRPGAQLGGADDHGRRAAAVHRHHAHTGAVAGRLPHAQTFHALPHSRNIHTAGQ